MSTIERIETMDARALAVGLTLTQLAKEAKVSSATMARLRKNPAQVRVRVFSKLEAVLTQREGA